MKRWTAIAVLVLGTWSSAQADEALKAALAGAQRTPAYAARDAWRHPYETLSFFGIRPDMMTSAKALSAAMQPISAVLVNARIHDAMLAQSDTLGSFAYADVG